MLLRLDTLGSLLQRTAIAALLFCGGLCPTFAFTRWNVRSPLGINLNSVTSYSTEQPFVNIFVTNDGWITHGRNIWDTDEEPYLQLDANGYPKTLIASQADPHSPQIFNSVGVVLEQQGGPYLYPSGEYIVRYDGEGRLAYGSDARLVSSSPGRDVIEVANPSNSGIDLRIIATDPRNDGNYIRNIRVVRRQNEATFNSGQLFDPTFLILLQRFRVLRFMDWLRTNGSPLSSWLDRPLPSYYSWGTRKGVPIEIAIALANAVSADAWLNIPAMADDTYIRRMAELVHAKLGSAQKVYVEYSNEVWNSSSSQYRYASAQGESLWPNRLPGNNRYEWNRNWYGMRTAQLCDIWKSVWRSDSKRVVCVLGAQAAYSYSATDALDCPYWRRGAPCSTHGIGAIAIAPYFGDERLASKWARHGEGGLSLLFRSLGSPVESNSSSVIGRLSEWATHLRVKLARHRLIAAALGGETRPSPDRWFQRVTRWENSYAAIAGHYHLPLIAYEGGQSFVGGSNEEATKLFVAANRDPRMGTAYTEYLRTWKASGGGLFVLYNDVGGYSRYGEWGALESLMQLRRPTTALPPKWRAIQQFIISTPCWWPVCGSRAGRRFRVESY